MIQMQLKTCALLLTIVVLGNYYGLAQNREIEDKVRQDILNRLPDFEIHKIEQKHWGGAWVFGSTNTKFERSVNVRGTYGRQGQWLRDIWFISSENLPTAILNQIPEGADSIRFSTYNENSLDFKHFDIEVKSGKFHLFNEQLEEIPYGPLVDGIVMTPKLEDKIIKKLKNPMVLNGWRNDDLTRQIFAVTFETDNGHINKAQIVFDNDNNWVKTVHYLRDYFKLPLELLIYVNDIGGLEVFYDITKVEDIEKIYYDVKLKDGRNFKLDVDLNEI